MKEDEDDEDDEEDDILDDPDLDVNKPNEVNIYFVQNHSIAIKVKQLHSYSNRRHICYIVIVLYIIRNAGSMLVLLNC